MIRHFGAMLALLLLSLSGAAPTPSRSSCRSRPADRSTCWRVSLSSDMQTRLNTEMVIENRGGGGGVIATEQVARAPRRRQDAAVRELWIARHQRGVAGRTA